MAQFQTYPLNAAIDTVEVNPNERLLKVDNNGVITRISKKDLLKDFGHNVAHDAGAFTSIGDALHRLDDDDIAGNQALHLITFVASDRSSPKQGLCIQDVSDYRTSQFIFWNGHVYARRVHYPAGTNRVNGWADANTQETHFPVGAKQTGGKVYLKNVHGDHFGEALPNATTTHAGLLSPEDKALLDKLRAKNLV